jgi:hypothetical protein
MPFPTHDSRPDTFCPVRNCRAKTPTPRKSNSHIDLGASASGLTAATGLHRCRVSDSIKIRHPERRRANRSLFQRSVRRAKVEGPLIFSARPRPDSKCSTSPTLATSSCLQNDPMSPPFLGEEMNLRAPRQSSLVQNLLHNLKTVRSVVNHQIDVGVLRTKCAA